MHEQVTITIDDTDINVDMELKDVIIALNSLGYKTSGCCIGDKFKEDSAWINIQETYEFSIIELMKTLTGSSYCMQKDLYIRNTGNYIENNKVYTQYILSTPKIDFNKRIKIINEWYNCLSQPPEIPPINYKYISMKELFK